MFSDPIVELVIINFLNDNLRYCLNSLMALFADADDSKMRGIFVLAYIKCVPYNEISTQNSVKINAFLTVVMTSNLNF